MGGRLLALFALCVGDVARLANGRPRPGARYGEFPPAPTDPGAPVLETRGMYVGTTMRPLAGPHRARGDWDCVDPRWCRLDADGIVIDRERRAQFLDSAGRHRRRAHGERGYAGKVMGTDSLLVIRLAPR